MSTLLVLVLLFSVFYSGHTIVAFLKPSHYLEKTGLSWLIGMQLISIEVFLLFYKTMFTLNSTSLLMLILANILISAVISKIAFGRVFFTSWGQVTSYVVSIKDKLKTSKLALAASLIIFTMVTASFISNVYWPIYDWDALALYDFRAKVILETGNIEQGKELGYFYHYPMFTSFLHSFLYVFSFEHAKIWYTIMYGSIILIFYGLLRKTLSFETTIIGTTLLALSPLLFGHSLMAYTNLAYTVFCSTGFLYLTVWMHSKNNYDLITGSLLIALSTLVRTTEPFWMTSSFIILLGAVRIRNTRTTILSILSVLLILYLKEPWLQYVATQTSSAATSPVRTLQNVVFDASLFEFINRVTVVSSFFITAVLKPQLYYFIALCLGAIVVFRKKMTSIFWDYIPFVSILLTILGGTFLFSYLFSEWESIPDSASRMAMVLIPLHLFLIIRNPVFFTKKLKSAKNR